MYIKETAHIKLRKANGLINIDYTACDIIFNEKNDTAAARSYNTIIGIFTHDNSSNKIYLETAGVYSTTTATKHKPRAARIADYNGYTIIEGIKPAIIEQVRDFYYCPLTEEDVDEIKKEAKQRQEILKALYSNNETAAAIKSGKYSGTIKARKAPAGHQFKNGNYLTKYFYKTNFKYLQNIYYEVNVRHVKTKIKGYNGPAGPVPDRKTFKIKRNIVNIEV